MIDQDTLFLNSVIDQRTTSKTVKILRSKLGDSQEWEETKHEQSFRVSNRPQPKLVKNDS